MSPWPATARAACSTMTENLAMIVGIEAVTAAQGIDFRAPLKTSAELQKAHAAIRAVVPALEVDRYMAGDLEPPPATGAVGQLSATASSARRSLPGLEVMQ